MGLVWDLLTPSQQRLTPETPLRWSSTVGLRNFVGESGKSTCRSIAAEAHVIFTMLHKSSWIYHKHKSTSARYWCPFLGWFFFWCHCLQQDIKLIFIHFRIHKLCNDSGCSDTTLIPAVKECQWAPPARTSLYFHTLDRDHKPSETMAAEPPTFCRFNGSIADWRK